MINVAFVRLKDMFETGPRYTTEEVRGWCEFRVERNFVCFQFACGHTIWYNNDHVVEFNTSEEEE